MGTRRQHVKLSKRARQAGITNVGRPKTPASLQRKRKVNRTARKGKGITNGRPQKWNREKTFTYVCDRVSAGRLATDVCKKLGLGYPTLMNWILADSTGEFSKRWQLAKQAQTHSLAARALRITQGKDGRGKAIKRHKKVLEKTQDPRLAEKIRQLEMTRISRNRLELDGIKWYARVNNPREFGDKVDLTTDGNALPAPPQALTVNFVTPRKRDA